MTISVPSYVIPGTWLENARFIAEATPVRAMELLFFLYDDDTKRLIEPEWAGLRGLKPPLRYTVHLPDTIAAEHEVLVSATLDLADAFIVHPPRTPEELPTFARLLCDWTIRYGERFRLENTRSTQFLSALSAVSAERKRHDLPGNQPLCLDLGHLVLEGYDPKSWLERYAADIQEIHLHGVRNGKDHLPFDGQESWFPDVRKWLNKFSGIVELELFSWKELEPCLALLEEA